jgi:hypothetical protein
MGFYKSLLIGTIVSLIITLAIMGVILGNSAKNQSFPSEYGMCPDYYTIDSQNTCKINSNIYSNVTVDCMNKNFDDAKYNVGGTGPISGLCEKKKWANTCGVSWDGITNNSNICYVT